MVAFFFYSFFFQAEDGIRDGTVTGVQTCALPISERPQHGRFRQFTQCDIDILGVSSEIAEIELILATAEALLALGLTDLTVRINDRRILAAIARHCGFAEGRFDSVFIALDKLDKLDQAGVIRELETDGHATKAI